LLVTLMTPATTDLMFILTLHQVSHWLGMLIKTKLHGCFPRVTLAGGDGRNHQACSIPILDAKNLQIKRKSSGSSHSWANFVTNHKSGFLAVDLGDNYPRGVNTHLLASEQTSKVVYQFKTHHATQKNGKDIYDDISTPEKNCQPNCQPNCQSNRQPNCQPNSQPNRYKYIFTFL